MIPVASTTDLPDPRLEPGFYEGVASKRALAWAVDMAIVFLLTLLAGIFTLTAALWVFPLTWLAIDALYRLATISGRSATLGMRLMGIEFRDHRGERLDGMQALLHTGGYLVSWAFLLPQLASMAAMLVTDRRQGLTDLLIGTTAVNRPG
jgi:uncharacterized RDD family membrane protein YckC